LLRRNRQSNATDERWVPGAAEQRALPPAREKRKFNKEADVGRLLSADRRSKAKTIVKKGEGDRGDRRA